jgi:hypothetical protein
MATKTIDVTLTAIRNEGPQNVSPNGAILCLRIRAQDDEQVFQTETLYAKSSGEPMNPSGATFIAPGQSLSYNVTKRLTISRFEEETEGHLNEALGLQAPLTQRVVDSGTLFPAEQYQGPHTRILQFQELDEIDGSTTVTLRYNVVFNGEASHKIAIDLAITPV